MSWLQQINGWAIATVFGLVVTVIAGLCVYVWRKGPPGPAHKQLWAGAKKAPVAAGIAGATLAISLVSAVVTSIALAAAPSGAASVASGVPSPTSTPAATPQPSAIAHGGWGPSRDLAKDDKRPVSATLNSVLDDPLAGDERGFMAIRLADDQKSTWSNDAVAIPGKVYEIGINVNNDAGDGGQAAQDVHVRVEMPGVAKVATAVSEAFITSSNTSPSKIWDGITFVSKGDSAYDLNFVAGSAVLHNGGNTNGHILPDKLFTTGTIVGCDQLDGVLPAGGRCRSWITFKVQINQPNFEVGAYAAANGTDVWAVTRPAAAGEQATLRVQYKNTGTEQQNNVVFKVGLPANMHYVRASAVLRNRSNDSLHLNNDEKIASGTGINVGNYAPGQSVSVTFDVVLDGPPGGGPQAQTVEKFLVVETSNGNKSAPLTFVWL